MTDMVRDEEWIGGSAVIRDPTGLHARPAVKLTKLAKSFGSAVEIRAESGDGLDERQIAERGHEAEGRTWRAAAYSRGWRRCEGCRRCVGCAGRSGLQ